MLGKNGQTNKKKSAEVLNVHFAKEGIQISIQHVKKALHLITERKLQKKKT